MIPLHPFCFIRGVCSGCFSVTRGPSTSGAGRKATRTTIVGEGAGRAKRGRAAAVQNTVGTRNSGAADQSVVSRTLGCAAKMSITMSK